MVAELKPQREEISRAAVVERVEAYIQDDETPNRAFALVYDEIVDAGDLEALATLHGVNLVGDIWRKWNLEHRPAAIARRTAVPVSPRFITGTVRPTQPSGRVHDPEIIRESLLDSRYRIDGDYYRFGEMNKALCLKLAQQYRKAAVEDEHKSRHIRAVAEALGEGETVEQKFTEDQLMRLFKIATPAGNMLA